MLERRKPIKVREAIAKVMEYARVGSIEYVPIAQSYGRYLGEDLIATHPVPPFDRSPYDGFALRSEDTIHAISTEPINFEVVGHIGAGIVFPNKVGRFEAVRIMTGAQIPDGCDTVEMLEAVNEWSVEGRNYVQIKRKLKRGENISYTGEDTKEGTVLAKKGTYINPGIVALLATFGYKKVPVSQKPTIGIIATGSELLEVGDVLQPGKIRNSNAYMIYSQIERSGGSPTYLGQFQDELEMCLYQVRNAIEQFDIVITTGGVSVGDFDYLPEIYRRLGAKVLFNKIAQRPGSVTTVAELDGKLLFGLSGNPSACYVGFELYVRPVIQAFLNSSYPFNYRTFATLKGKFAKPNPFDRFVRGHLSFENGVLQVQPVGLDKSNVVSTLSKANVLIILPGGQSTYNEGEKVSVIMLENNEGMKYEEFVNW